MTFSKFRLLLWKNLILAKRHPISTVFEIVFPIIVVSIFTFAKNAAEPTELPENMYKEFQLENCWSYKNIDRIVIAPVSNPELANLIEQTEFHKTFRKHNVDVQILGATSKKEDFMDNRTLIIKFSKENSVSIAAQFTS